MGSKVSTIGGGAATGLGNDFVKWLMGGLNTGTFGTAGAGSVNNTTGMTGVINDILSGGAGKVGGAMETLINRQNTQNINDLRARYGAFGGTGFGTPAAYAESQYRAQEPAQTTSAIGNLQLSAMQPLLNSIFGLSQRGIPQAESVLQPSTFSQVLQGLGSVAGPIASMFSPVTMGAQGVSPDAMNSYMQFLMTGPQMMGGGDPFGVLPPPSALQGLQAPPQFGSIPGGPAYNGGG